MYDFKTLKKAAKNQLDTKEIRLAVLGNCATQFFSLCIEGCGKLSGMNLRVYDADYNQIEAQLLDEHSETYSFMPNAILIWLATNVLYEEFLDMSLNEKRGFAEYVLNKLLNYWDWIERYSQARIIQPVFTEIDDKALGHYSCKVSSSFTYQIRKLNYLLADAMEKRTNVYPVDLLGLQARIGESIYYDAALYYNARMPISFEALPHAAQAVVDVVRALEGKLKKCIICDLDNTLWGGVIGDDGIGGIEIGTLGRGHAFSELQRWLKQLKQCGIILAVCSKNDEDTAKEPFVKHDEMVLRLSDFSMFIANWKNKAENILQIQQSLNIGMDSIVFIDDNPFERNLVRQLLPDVEVPELPEDPAHYLEYLQGQNYFETSSFTGNGADRTEQYQSEFKRNALKTSFSSIDDYLTELEMIGEANAFEPDRYARIAQLTQRSNQFNLRTIRYTESDIERIANSSQYLTRYFTLKDRFGDYGLVAIVIILKTSDTEGFMDTWLMSCRVLKRGMEEYIINSTIDMARKAGLKKLKAEYIPTPKNAMVCNIYAEMGFLETDKGQYSLMLDDYIPRKTHIRSLSSMETI